jgi:hypothetical protein
LYIGVFYGIGDVLTSSINPPIIVGSAATGAFNAVIGIVYYNLAQAPVLPWNVWGFVQGYVI